MFVLTIDQRGSTRAPDRVPALLATIERATGGRGVVLPFERTVGDELQGLLDDAAVVLDVVAAVLRDAAWSLGLGIGAVATPLPASTRAATGPAYLHAREAVERAKTRAPTVPLAVTGPDERAADEIEALLRLLGAVITRRTPAGWEAVDALDRLGSQTQVATHLGISDQAVSQRLRAALRAEERAVRPLATRLLEDADR
ncbi:SatD family protein [Sediminihabitans luteus]|uniref:SatD family protein n=1 Tax=Sediminihabitans luteus TaxID=1138585 RepID=A0A2M9CQK2_9CELL|nr:SatD family protein [Sediminihabitans luteus]PJJ74203.1 SatD family protein [Sediminihabitans luteus]GII99056.1 transcriptional regulator [Sediminihabitans luteus]